jgi:Fe-S cluster assembly protein SufD
MSVVTIKTPFESAVAERYAAEKASLPGAAAERAAAFARFEQAGLPSKRVEAYHYTDLRNALRSAPLDSLSEGVESGAKGVESTSQKTNTTLGSITPFVASDLSTVVFTDGVIGVIPPLEKGISLESLAVALQENRARLGGAMGQAVDSVVDINTALTRDGCAIKVSGSIDAPLHLAFVTRDKGHSAPRVIIEVAKGASITLVESHVGPDGAAYLENSVVEISLGAGAKVEHIRLNEAGDTATALSTLAVTLEAGAEFTSIGLNSGGALSRHQVFATYAGENVKLSLSGASMIKGRQHADTTLVVDHAVPHGNSRELFRTVADGSAQGVFQGKIIVRQHAQKTDGQMASNAILLSDDAGMSNKPELEIFADDVVCAHGATCGSLDDNQLFYLMARGLPRAEAEALLVEAFLDEVLEAITHQAIRDALSAKVSAWMATRAT